MASFQQVTVAVSSLRTAFLPWLKGHTSLHTVTTKQMSLKQLGNSFMTAVPTVLEINAILAHRKCLERDTHFRERDTFLSKNKADVQHNYAFKLLTNIAGFLKKKTHEWKALTHVTRFSTWFEYIQYLVWCFTFIFSHKHRLFSHTAGVGSVISIFFFSNNKGRGATFHNAMQCNEQKCVIFFEPHKVLKGTFLVNIG